MNQLIQYMSDRKNWSEAQHESKVENFYGTGVDGFHEYHNGYLNFGYWTGYAMRYEEAAENLVKHVGEVAALNHQDQLLDIGCGMGTQDIFFHKHFNPKTIDALDVTWKHIERGRERAQRAGIAQDRVRFHHGSAVKLPFADKSFTKITSIEAAEHFDTREAFLREASRVLKPGGRLVVCDYSLVREPKNAIERWLVKFAQKIWQVPDANVYGNAVYQQKLQAAGFKDVHINNVGKYTIPGYYHEHRRWDSMMGAAKVRGWLKGIIGGFLIDWGVYHTFKRGLVEYVIIRADRA